MLYGFQKDGGGDVLKGANGSSGRRRRDTNQSRRRKKTIEGGEGRR